MADNYSLCLLTVMDRLWYHEIILFSSDSPSSSSSSTLAPESQTLDSSLHLPNNSTLNIQQQQTPSPLLLPSHHIPITHHYSEEEEPEERLTRMNPLSSTTTSHRRSHSSSIVERRPGHIRRSSSSSMREIGKYLSCRSFRELEMEELKGLMDLGFIFNTENVSPRMASVVPGLHRLGLHNYNIKFLESDSEKYSASEEEYRGGEEEEEDSDIVRDYDEDQEEEKGIMRPYLSEAWLIKKPNSPLLNIKLPRGNSADSDMKKHLKFWARAVASVIQQES